MRAAVMDRLGELEIPVYTEVRAGDLGPGEVRVRIKAAGICHSDLSVMSGTIRAPLPTVLGHEGAGEVVALGAGVSSLAVGDHVVIAWIAPCGACRTCLRGEAHLCTVHAKRAAMVPKFTLGDGRQAYGMAGCGTWAEEIVVPAAGAIRIDDDVPFDIAALLGCGVTTGVCAVLRTAQVSAGSSVLVVGCGGVGINVIQGARLAGAARIVAVDPIAYKRDLALTFGADLVADPDELSTVLAGAGLGKGTDYTFDVVGAPTTIRMAWDRARRGGHIVVVGVGGTEQSVTFSPAELVMDGKTLSAALYGSADVRRDVTMLIDLWRGGRLNLAGLISARLDLSEINAGLDNLRAGKALRQLIMFE